jgi:hypothetical protein
MNRGYWPLCVLVVGCATFVLVVGCSDDDPTGPGEDGCLILVTEPAESDVWISESAERISWIGSGGGEGVRIDLYRAEELVQEVLAYTPNDGSTSWVTSMAGQNTGSNYRIKISSLSRPSCTAFSDTFTLVDRTECQIVVERPSLRDSWNYGEDQEIQWTSQSTSTRVKIELIGGPVAVGEIAANTADDGNLLWRVWSFNGGSGNYSVKVTDTHITECFGLSDFFHLEDPTACRIVFTRPVGGEVWREGENQTIAWDQRRVSSYINIDLLYGNANVGAIATFTPNDSTHVWTVDTFGQEPGGGYRILITDAMDSYCSEFSPAITILSAE